jgi:signal transduction histidine kinase
MKNVLNIILLLCLPYWGASQPADKNKMLEIAQRQRQNKGFEKDTSYIMGMAHLAHLYYSTNTDSVFFYANYALVLARQAGYQKGIAESLRQLGNAYGITGDMPQSLGYYQQSLQTAQLAHDKLLTCYALSNIGLTYINLGQYNDALGYTMDAYRLGTELGDSLRVAGDLSNLSSIYFGRGEFDKAFESGQKAMQMAKRLHNDYYEAFLGCSLGDMLAAKGGYRDAMQYYTKALAFYKKTGDSLGMTNTYLAMARVWHKQQNTGPAISYASQSLRLAKCRKGKKDIADAAGLLADIYETAGDAVHALQYLRMAKQYGDSLFNDETQKKLYELQVKFNYEQKEAAKEEAQAKKDILNSQKLQNQKLEIITSAMVILTLCIVLVALFKSRAGKQRHNEALVRMNTEILSQKEEIEATAAELKKSNALKDKLFSIISHDLRGPFISLQSLLTLFKNDALSTADIKDIILKLDVNVDYTVALVTNLLGWALGQMGGITAKPVPVALENLLGVEVAGIEKRAADKGIQVGYGKVEAKTVFADADMLQLLLRNLLANAVKFCRAGDTISLSAVEKDSAVEISVIDTGPGMPADIIQKINSGESVTTYGTSKEKGTGLGLMLCKDLAKRNGWHFSIESSIGFGSRFSLILPTG